MFVPFGFKPGADGFDLTLFLHGAPGAVERNFVRARRPGVLVTVVLPGLSETYARKFRDPEVFPRILSQVRERLAEGGTAPAVRSVTVSCFSAGYGGVRELLKEPRFFDRIDALVTADSIYAGFENDPALRVVSAENMAGFLRFARQAAVGRKRFVLSHTQLHTPTYASTAETADFLIRQFGGERQAADEVWPGGLRLTSRFRLDGFEVLGFAGETGEDHMQHLRWVSVFWERLAVPALRP